MSNRELRPSSEEALQPLKEEELSAEVLSSTRSSWFGSSNEDKENRPPTNADTQQVLPDWDSDLSWTWDTERVEYGADPVKLQKELKKATRKLDDIDDERRRWYGEDADEAMQYQFRFTPEEIRNRAAGRHGGQTFYEYMVSIGKALDLNRIVGDESSTQAGERAGRLMAEWRNGTYPYGDQVDEDSEGDEYDQGDGHYQGDGHGHDNNYNNGDDYDDGDRDKGNRKRTRSEPETSIEETDSGNQGDDEDGSGTGSTNRTRLMPESHSETRNPKRKRLSDGASDHERTSRAQRSSAQLRNDEAAASQLQLDLYHEQLEQTDEQHQLQQIERRILHFQQKEIRDSLDRRQSDQQQQSQPQQLPQQLLQQQPQQQEFEEEEEEEERVRTRQEYEREAALQRDLEEVRSTQRRVRAHLRGLRLELDNDGTTPEGQELWELQTEYIELLQQQERTIQQRQRVVEQESLIRDRQYQRGRLFQQIARVRSRWNEVDRRREIRRQERMVRGPGTADWIEDTGTEELLDQLRQQEQNLIQQLQELDLQIQRLQNNHRVQQRRWEELRERQGQLEQARERRAEGQPQEAQTQQQQQQERQQPGDPCPSQLSSLQNRLEREQEQERGRRQQGGYPVESQSQPPPGGPPGPQHPRQQQQGRRPQSRNPDQPKNQPPPIPQHIIGPHGPQQPQQQQQGRRQQSRSPAQSQNQPAPPPSWPLGRPQASRQPRQQLDRFNRDQSRWSDSSSSAGSRKRRWETSSGDTEVEEEEEEERNGRRSVERARRQDPAPEQTRRLSAVQEASLALQRAIKETPQPAEGTAEQTSGQASGQAPRRLLPAAQIREGRPTPKGVQVSTLFSNPRIKRSFGSNRFTGRPSVSGGAWLVGFDEAANARDILEPQRRIALRQAETEAANAKKAIFSDSDNDPDTDTSKTPSPTPPPKQPRPRHSLPARVQPLPFPRPSSLAQLPAHLQTPTRIGPRIHPQPSTYPRAPTSAPTRQPLAQIWPVPQPIAQPAEASTASPPSPPSTVPETQPASSQAQDPAPAPASARPRPRRGRETTARSPIRKSTRMRKQISRARESEEQAAAIRRPTRGQTLRQKQIQRQRERQSQTQAQAQPPAPTQAPAQPPAQPPAQNQTVNSNPGQAPAQNNTKSGPQRRRSRRPSRWWTQPYDVSNLRRSTRNRKPPDRYAPPTW